MKSEINQLIKLSGTISDDAMMIKILQLLVKVGDSHTSSNISNSIPNTFLPINLYMYDEGIFILGTADGDQTILGNKLVAINDFPMARITDSLSTLFVAENEGMFKTNVVKWLIYYPILQHFGFCTSEKITITSENYYGIPMSTVIRAKEFESVDPDDWDYVRFSGRNKVRRPYTKNIFDQKYIKKDSTYFIIYNKCTGREIELVNAIMDSMEYKTNCNIKLPTKTKDKITQKPPLPYFRVFRDSIILTLKTKPIRKIVFDLSQNGGGVASQGSKLIELMSEMLSKDTLIKVYVIVSRKTFSAGIIHAMELKRTCNATILGEATSGKPNFFGSTESYYLPQSCLRINFARSFRKTTENESNTLVPDVVFPMRFQNIISGIDPVYAYIKNH
ncbi:MAG: hypothetical protein IPO92_11240 [Saprospiraceae bacterium]|nr:hypothetical protein [Saprospiraceae bacterium]